MSEDVKRYPLFFKFDELVRGDRFLARVRGTGRILAEEDEDGFWFHGVFPGGMSDGGATIQDATRAFMAGLRVILATFADESEGDVQAFSARVESFFRQEDEVATRLWNESLAEVRAGKTDITELQRWKADQTHDVVEVLVRVDPSQLRASDAIADEDAAAIAA